MPRARDENKELKIYIAALSIILKDGFAGITMSKVAAKAKMAAGTIYIYFKNKNELINKLYLHLKHKHAVIYFDRYHTEMDFETGFKTIWKNYLKTILQFPDEAAYMEQCKHTKFLTPKTKKETDAVLLPIAQLLERGIKEGHLKTLRIDLMMAHLSGSANEMARLYHENSSKVQISEKEMFGLAWSSVKK